MGLRKSPSCISPNHTSFIEDFPGTYGRHCPHTKHAYKHTFINAHIKIHIKHSILREDLEANSFYFKKLDVFMPRWKLNQTPSNQAIARIVGHAYLLITIRIMQHTIMIMIRLIIQIEIKANCNLLCKLLLMCL